MDGDWTWLVRSTWAMKLSGRVHAVQFPVMHRLHLEIFDTLFPPEFKNQHGDPYLWNVYRRWGAAVFAELPAQLTNGVGGSAQARYDKTLGSRVLWSDRVLTDAIGSLERWLGEHAPAAQRFTCMDVVVPTYRCELQALEALISLQCPEQLQVDLSILVVVDNPRAPNLAAIRSLLSYAAHRVVRVCVLPANVGAPTARNIGLDQSWGDYVVLLDDDVQPSAALIPAYLGAMARYPNAAGYVGLTQLPPARTLMQHALQACGMCYFYGIAAKVPKPSWAVTANLCVRARTNTTTRCAAITC